MYFGEGDLVLYERIKNNLINKTSKMCASQVQVKFCYLNCSTDVARWDGGTLSIKYAPDLIKQVENIFI